MLDNEPQINFDSIQAASPSKRRQLVLALTLLLTALVLVVLRNREFWTAITGLEAVPEHTTSAPVTTAKKSGQRLGSSLAKKSVVEAGVVSNGEPQGMPSAGTPATDSSPLRVDVTYSSGQHQTLLASNSAIRIDPQQNPYTSAGAAAGAPALGGDSSGGVRVRFSGQMVELLGHPAEPVYPLVAQQAHVQGSVVLQARITEDGRVEALEVVSGPPMLTSAALEAVKQWQFKPHYEAGQAVATQTRITVNFTISAQ